MSLVKPEDVRQDLVDALTAAVEGECDGFAITERQARMILGCVLSAQQDAPTDAEILETMRGHIDEADGGYACDTAEEHVIAAGRALLARFAPTQDAERIDWLESQINEHGAIHLHDGNHPAGHGLGLRPGNLVRTLREAIDAARAQRAGKEGA